MHTKIARYPVSVWKRSIFGETKTKNNNNNNKQDKVYCGRNL